MAVPCRASIELQSLGEAELSSLPPEHPASEDPFGQAPLNVSDGFMPRSARRDDAEAPRSQFPPSTQPAGMTISLHITPATQGRSKRDEAAGSLGLRHDGVAQHPASPPISEPGPGAAVVDPIMKPALSPHAYSSSSQVPGGFSDLGGTSSNSETALGSRTTSEGTDDGARGPQHPYALYPQNTVPEDQPVSRPSTIPVGFSGLPQAYDRPADTRGEEPRDMISPDGYAEQLPPYSRYPNSQLPRPSGEPQARLEEPATPRVAVLASAEPGISQHPLDNSESRISTRTGDSDSSQESSAGTPNSHSPMKGKWTSTSKKRVCCGRLPLWAVVMFVLVIILVISLVTGILSRVGFHKRIQQLEQTKPPAAAPTSTIYATTTTTYDAAPLASLPPDLPRLPSGTYLLSLGEPDIVESNCVADALHASAWSCDLSMSQTSKVQLQITPAQDSTPDLIQLSVSNPQAKPLRYGTQPPSIDKPQRLSMVMDQTDPKAGPAFVFQVPHSKVVILAGNTFSPGQVAKRGIEDVLTRERGEVFRGHELSRRGVELQPGDKPWYCYWNETILEGFIYVTKNTSSSNQNATSAGSSSNNAQSTAASATSSASPIASEAGETFPLYPKAVKLVERRHPSTPSDVKPYCQQMQVLDNLDLGPISEPGTEDPMVVTLNETASMSSTSRRKRWGITEKKSGIAKRSDASPQCLCVWSTG